LNKISITLRGNAVKINRYSLTYDDYGKLLNKAEQWKESIEYCWFQQGFISKDFKAILSGAKVFSCRGLLLDAKGIMEIKVNGRIKGKIRAGELLRENLLFPLFNAEIGESRTWSSNESIKIITECETSVGLIGKATKLSETFSYDDLKFKIEKTNCPDFIILQDLKLRDANFNFINEDTVITGQHLFSLY
jgi:hypothetical protein